MRELRKFGFISPKAISYALKFAEKMSITKIDELVCMQEEALKKKKRLDRGTSSVIIEFMLNEIKKSGNAGIAAKALLSSFCYLQSDGVSMRMLYAITTMQKMRVTLEIKGAERMKLMDNALSTPNKRVESIIYCKQVDIPKPTSIRDTIKLPQIVSVLEDWSLLEKSEDGTTYRIPSLV